MYIDNAADQVNKLQARPLCLLIMLLARKMIKDTSFMSIDNAADQANDQRHKLYVV